ncbi:MAG: ABC transporter permease [Bacteroidales bacterium]|nr:ABC transporter permease [Bacteroidales bacterium]
MEKNNTGMLNALKSVFLREWGRMTSRRIYFGVCVVIPMFILVFMLTIFGNGKIEQLPVGAVDMDNSSTSRNISRNVSAVPTINLQHFADAATAQDELLKGKIYGYFVIPPNFESDVLGMRSPTISYYYHFVFISVGNILMADLTTIFKTIAAAPILQKGEAMGISPDLIMFKLMPVQTHIEKIGNPWLNYELYLSTVFVFVLLQIQILLITVYTIGIELKKRTAHAWLKAANKNVFIAVTGKLLPYTIIFVAEALFFNVVLFVFCNNPLSCSIWQLHGLAVLFVLATQAFGLFIISLLPLLRISISMASLLGSLGATLAGLTFPVEGMPKFIHVMSYLFPIRQFTVIFQTNALWGLGFSYCWQSYALLVAALIPPLFLMFQLKREMIYYNFQEK